jgi:hypothetical protein
MSRRPEAHYSITVERSSAYRWLWRVSHRPAIWHGHNGPVYPPLDWSAGGSALTREAAHRAADRAIADRMKKLEYESEAEHREVVG